jgi:hypothetical protein
LRPVAVAGGASGQLRDKIELLLPALTGVSRRLFEHPRIAAIYPEYLVTTHGIIRASVPLMEAAREQAVSLAAADPVAAAVAGYLEEHIEEELHHDEWLLDDLEVLGIERSAVLERLPSPTVAALVGAQYYWLLHYHPVALLGYIALLEGYPPTGEAVRGLIERTGYPPEAFRTLLAHAELDPHHREELDETLDSLPLTPAHSTAIGVSAMYSVHMATRAIEEVVDGAG